MAINVTPEGIGTGIAALCAIAITVRYVVRSEFAEFRENMRVWVNGSFMRSSEALVRLDAIEEKVERVHRDGCAHRVDHLEQ